MDATIINLIASLLTGVVAGITAKSVTAAISKRGKKVITINPAGKEEEIAAPAGASEKDIRRVVLEAIRFENTIAEALKQLEKDDPNLTFRSSKAVDFVASISGRKLAIEAKLDPKTVRRSAIRHYLKAESGIERVFIVSPSEITGRTRDLIDKDPDGNRVQFVQIKRGSESLQDQLGAELKAALLSAPAA